SGLFTAVAAQWRCCGRHFSLDWNGPFTEVLSLGTIPAARSAVRFLRVFAIRPRRNERQLSASKIGEADIYAQ
ncbi:hypothetical protein, partial [Martelella sp. HB161492]|uniref:hypothetical protein n=1 Tax=Martelella sp. HB161492 TaxID=2720726 RepID=UPI001AEEF75C